MTDPVDPAATSDATAISTGTGTGTGTERIGVYPGTFDPPTIAHLEIARCAAGQLGLARVDFTISSSTLGKDDARLTPIEDRLAELWAVIGDDIAMTARSTPDSLIVDIAEGYDVIVLGADKWAQVLDPVWYGGIDARDDALRRLPTVALAPRAPWTELGTDPAATAPADVTVVVLDIDPVHHQVSATAVRGGRDEWRARPSTG